MGELELFSFAPPKPCIVVLPHDKLTDCPATHRWRGHWDCGEHNAEILLYAYPVIKETPCGAWIHEFPYGEWTHENGDKEWVWRFRDDDLCKRWVSNDGNQAWAKKTQREAIHSMAIRLARYAANTRERVDDIMRRAALLRAVAPQHEKYAASAENSFPNERRREY